MTRVHSSPTLLPVLLLLSIIIFSSLALFQSSSLLTEGYQMKKNKPSEYPKKRLPQSGSKVRKRT